MLASKAWLLSLATTSGKVRRNRYGRAPRGEGGEEEMDVRRADAEPKNKLIATPRSGSLRSTGDSREPGFRLQLFPWCLRAPSREKTCNSSLLVPVDSVSGWEELCPAFVRNAGACDDDNDSCKSSSYDKAYSSPTVHSCSI